MAAVATAWLGYEFWRLVLEEPGGANDLKERHDEVVRWFDGVPIYREAWTSVYPPAMGALSVTVGLPVAMLGTAVLALAAALALVAFGRATGRRVHGSA